MKKLQSRKVSIQKRLFVCFVLTVLILCAVVTVILVRLNRETADEKERHMSGNYARIESMLKEFEFVLNHTEIQNQMLSASLYLTPHFSEASRETLEAEMHEDWIPSLMKWHKNIIGEGTDYAVSIRYSPASGCYLGASMDDPDGFMAFDFANLYQTIHLSGQVTEQDFVRAGSFHICRLESVDEDILLFTTVHEGSGTVMIYGFQPQQLENTVFSANIGPSYQYLSTHLVLPDGQFLLSSADGEDDLSSSELRKLLLREEDIFIDGDRTLMKIQERNGGFTLVYSLIEIQKGPMNGNLIQMLMICMVFVTLAILIIAAVVLRLLYGPISSLAKTVSVPSVMETEKRTNDPLDQISSAIEYYRRQADLSRVTIEEQNDALFRSVLLKMMLDSSYAGSGDEITYFHLNERLRSFILMSVKASSALWDPEKMSHSERVYHRNLALLDAESEIENEYANFSPICLRHDRKTFVLFRVDEEGLALLRNMLMDTLVRLNRQEKATYIFRFSKIYSGPGALHNAYDEVLYRADFTLSADREPVLQEHVSTQHMLQLENRLISLVYVENYAKAYDCLEEIVRLIFQSEQSDAMIKSQVQSISLRTFRMLMESDPDHRSRLDALFSGMSERMQDYTLNSVLEFWKEIFDELESGKTAAGTESSSEEFNAVLEYIRLHFRDPNLSLTSLSDLFHRPIASLSRDFQKYLGKGFLEVLHGLRLEAAEEEIRTTQSPMKVVAEHAGYTSEITMTRAFKKYRGVTPGVYRAQKEKEGP